MFGTELLVGGSRVTRGVTGKFAESGSGHKEQKEEGASSLRRLLEFIATIHVVWLYLAVVPSAMDLLSYERGTGPMPFQGRILLMFPMQWAHDNLLLQRVAMGMASMPGWFGRGPHPEGIVEALLDVCAVMLAGWIARRLYLAASPLGLLTPFMYPLTLVMITATYVLNAVHPLRFVYDLPSLALFSLGLEAIYFRRSIFWFALVFTVVTANRETSLFLLLLEALTLWSELKKDSGGRRSYGRLAMLALLLGAWVGWHIWAAHLFATNRTAVAPRLLLLNAGTLLCPLSWPQLLSAGAFCGPLLVFGARRVADARLRVWRWALPIWFCFMLFYGLLIETRIFGELIAYAACCVALLAEQEMALRLRSSKGSSACSAECIAGRSSSVEDMRAEEPA